jgi:hypothetical protein
MARRPTVWVQPKEYKLVGAALAAARERAGLTQAQLERLLRKPQSFISNILVLRLQNSNSLIP